MIIELSGKTAIVTGSTGGIGLAIARGLADAGATVVICGREQERVDAALAQLRTTRAGSQARGVVADLGTAAGCQALINAEPDADILVNNLGIYGVKAFFDIDDADWEAFFQVNVMSGVRLARHYAQGMKARGWGRPAPRAQSPSLRAWRRNAGSPRRRWRPCSSPKTVRRA